jgi:hypothetical protein
VSDEPDLERQLRDVPGRFPIPDEDLTRRVEQRVLALQPRLSARIAGAVTLALVAATFVGIAIGRWVFPPPEPALAVPTAPAITIDARPRVASTGMSITIVGSIVVRQGGERVRVEENPCGRGWRYLKLVETDERGNWSAAPAEITPAGSGRRPAPAPPPGTAPRPPATTVQAPAPSPASGEFVFASMRTAYRAVWRGARSVTVSVAVRPAVILRYRARQSVEALVPAAASLDGRKITFQRLVGARWRAVRQVGLKEEQTPYGRTYTARLRPAVPRGTQVRAALTLPQARPCYVGAFSNILTID